MNSHRNVIMLHSVGSNLTQWKERWLSVDKQQFELFCKYLFKHKYKTHFLSHWYAMQNSAADILPNDLYLTFDDGYLDNLLVAFPIMRQYGIKGTIFINPEFVDPSSGVRTLETHPSTLGFLNWDEIMFLDKSGVFDIQSHSMSHNYLFSSNKVIDIHQGDNKYHWLAWLSRPDEKPFWQDKDQGHYTVPGTPVFEYYRALGTRQYFPDAELVKMAVEAYSKGIDVETLKASISEWQKSFPGRFETDEQMRKRFEYELFESKRILEEKLEKTVDFLCWPGGGYNVMSLKIAEEAGYKASTVASKDPYVVVDNNGKEYKRIVRFGMSSVLAVGGYLRKVRVIPVRCSLHLIFALWLEEKRQPARFFLRLYRFVLKFL